MESPGTSSRMNEARRLAASRPATVILVHLPPKRANPAVRQTFALEEPMEETMTLFVMLTRLSPAAIEDPHGYSRLESRVVERIASECPDVRWQRNLALLGSYDYLDIFEAPDLDQAMKVSAIVRSDGRSEVEIWPAEEWREFKELVDSVG